MGDRSFFRNILIYDASDKKQLGGLWQAGSLTEDNLHWMLGRVLLITKESWTLRYRASNRIVMPSNNPAALGEYDIHCDGQFFPVQSS